MRNLKSIALIAALALTNVSHAEMSTPVDYDNATVGTQNTDVGSFGQAVSFDVSTGLVDLNTDTLKPGETYTITIPVHNPTDRDITVSLTNPQVSAGAASVATITPGSAVVVPAGGDDNLTITVTLKGAGSVVAGSTITVSYGVSGTSAAY